MTDFSRANCGRLFMEQTRYSELKKSDQQNGVPRPPMFDLPKNFGKRIQLPDCKILIPKKNDFHRIINDRCSERDFSNKALSLEDLAYLLRSTQGVKEIIENLATLRIVPSAGARHPFETVIQVNQVEGLTPGMYHFDSRDNCLLQLESTEDFAEKNTEACLGQSIILNSAAVFYWVAFPYRSTWRYSERGYRYILLDAGHVGQNLYLAAESIGCGACGVAAYDDDKLNKLLGLDEESFVAYLGVVGFAE
jgi:SagB-type dehydrogenase family enzyme